MMRPAVAPGSGDKTLHSNGSGESTMNRRSASLAFGIVIVCSFQGLVAQEKPIAIVHASIIDGMGGPPTEDGAVILRGNKIEYAGPSGVAAIPRDAQIIDGKGKSVMPGLADRHVHLQGGWGGISVDLAGDPRYLEAMLFSRITTMMDTGNYQPWILQ